MKRSIATVSLSGTLPEKLEAAAAAGFDGVELFENDLLYHSGSPQDIRRLCVTEAECAAKQGGSQGADEKSFHVALPSCCWTLGC